MIGEILRSQQMRLPNRGREAEHVRVARTRIDLLNPRMPLKEEMGREKAKRKSGAPGEIRTPDLLLRRQSLYPSELRAHATRVVYTGGSRGFNAARSMLQDRLDLRKIKPFTMRGTKRHEGFCWQELFRGTFSYDFARATGRKN